MSEFDALKALLESVPELAGRVRDSVTDRDGGLVRGTYLVLYGAGPSELDDGRYGGIPRPDSDALYEFPLRAVSIDAEGVRLLAGLVQSVVGRKPSVADRKTDPLTVEFEAAQVDNSVSPPLHFMDMHVEFWSRRS